MDLGQVPSVIFSLSESQNISQVPQNLSFTIKIVNIPKGFKMFCRTDPLLQNELMIGNFTLRGRVESVKQNKDHVKTVGQQLWNELEIFEAHEAVAERQTEAYKKEVEFATQNTTKMLVLRAEWYPCAPSEALARRGGIFLKRWYTKMCLPKSSANITCASLNSKQKYTGYSLHAVVWKRH